MDPIDLRMTHKTPDRHPFDEQVVAALRSGVPDLQAVYRYGSAGGEFERPESDIDLAVLAKRPLTLEEKLQMKDLLARLAGRDVDLHDLRALPVTLRVQIVIDGVRLYAANIPAAEEYDSRTLSDYVRLNEERRGILDDVRRRGSIRG